MDVVIGEYISRSPLIVRVLSVAKFIAARELLDVPTSPANVRLAPLITNEPSLFVELVTDEYIEIFPLIVRVLSVTKFIAFRALPLAPTLLLSVTSAPSSANVPPVLPFPVVCSEEEIVADP